MIMRPGQPLLLPVNPAFIWVSLVGALLLAMLIQMGLFGRAAWVPDLLALTLLFWVVHELQRISVGTAFVFGLLVDVHQGALLGQHALAYSTLAYLASLVQRRMLWFDPLSQALQALPLLFIAHALQWAVRALAGDGWIGWSGLLAPPLEALLWPAASWLLLAPQRRPHEPDANRPI